MYSTEFLATGVNLTIINSNTQLTYTIIKILQIINELEIWANAQRDGRNAEYRWRPLFKPQSLADAKYWNAVQ